MTTAFDAVVLAGGSARRLGGADKPGVRVGGRPLLDRVLAGCRDARRTVVVAAPRATSRPVDWAREEPPGGGPVAALDAGLHRLAGLSAPPGPPAPPASTGGSADPASADPAPAAPASVVLVLSADLPFFDAAGARRLVAALETAPEADGVCAVDAGGRHQPLVAAYRAGALRRALDQAAAEHGGTLDGLALRRVTGALNVVPVPPTAPVPAAPGDSGPLDASFDCDTWGDVATARARIREHGHVLNEWITAVKDELGIDLDVDTTVLLDLARDAAHGVARPAAPLTTFLVGYAAARAEGGPDAVAEAARKAAALAQRWAAEQDDAG
ncbi:DUF6457 domain-containing protein [Streptomyces sp. NPDC046203]|uniref:DUF6457 domain-containing protein n=1 Tax=Streptomyces sp. NPDC046203 TaxID=3154602 RepID=UPI0033EDCEDA